MPDGNGRLTSGQGRHTGIDGWLASAQKLERDEPVLVARAADDLRTASEEDHKRGAPRGRAYVRNLQELAVGCPALGIAVARELGLEHIVEDLLNGISVEGVPGIGSDGAPMSPTSRHRTRRRGAWLLATSALVLLVEAIVADDLVSMILYVWTAVGLGLFFVGGYLVILKE
jgi:hypothetical protein